MSEEGTYTPNPEVIEERYNRAIEKLGKIDDPIHPVIDIADKYFASKPKEVDCCLYDIANNILSDMSLMSHAQKCLDGSIDIGEFNGPRIMYEPLLLMLKHSNKLLLYMIVEIKTLINTLTKNTSNISYLFHTGERCFIITEDKYCIPIIEAHMENPCDKHDYGKTTNKLIRIQYDLLERLENQLAAKIGDEDKHAWIEKRFSFNKENDITRDVLAWRKNLDAFYKVRDEQIQKKKDEENTNRREREMKTQQEISKLQHEYRLLRIRSDELKKLIADKENELQKME